MRKIPKLRFKEFSDEWEEKKLGDICKFSKGKLISKEDISEEGTECIRYGELYTNYNEVITKIISKTNLDVSTLVLSEINDIIIPSSGETATDIAKASCVMKSGVALGGDLNILKFKENGVYTSYYMNSFAKKQIASLAQGASVFHLYENHLKKLKIKFPIYEEQEKIANFLSSVDKKISLTEEKLELFKQYKKGIMQKLFSQEMRFKDSDGNDYPDWEEKILGDIVIFKKGKLLSKNDLVENGKNKCILYGELFTKYNELIEKVESKTNLEIEKIGKKYDILMPTSDVTPNGLAKACCLLEDEIILSGDMNILTPKNSLYSCYFVYQLNYEKNKIIERVTGTSVKHIYVKDIENLSYNIPCIEEQKKIAGFLNSIDEKVESIEKELEGLKEFKKGLLQKMFV